MTELDFTPVPDGRVEVGGKVYMTTAKGGLQPVETIKPQQLLEDERVRKIVGYALAPCSYTHPTPPTNLRVMDRLGSGEYDEK